MDITKRLLELDPTLARHNEGHWDKPFDPNISSFSSFNDAGIEVETGEFFYGLVRLLKPDYILETGTHIGVSACYMGQALKDNGGGTLETYEFLPENYHQASQRIDKMGLPMFVKTNLQDVATIETNKKYQLIFLDTEPQTRFAELIKFFPNLAEGGYLFIHDLHRHMHQIPNTEHGFAWPYGVIPQAMTDLVISGKLRPMHFSTPRGLTGFYKPSSADYKWVNYAGTTNNGNI